MRHRRKNVSSIILKVYLIKSNFFIHEVLLMFEKLFQTFETTSNVYNTAYNFVAN